MELQNSMNVKEKEKKSKQHSHAKFIVIVSNTVKVGIPIIIAHNVNRYKTIIPQHYIDAYIKDLRSKKLIRLIF